jgi:hypothetical protein
MGFERFYFLERLAKTEFYLFLAVFTLIYKVMLSLCLPIWTVFHSQPRWQRHPLTLLRQGESEQRVITFMK